MNEIDIRRLDMTLLLVFSELMRHRKLTIVAHRLGLTQSTISHALRRLRDIFGDELFLRHAGGVEPTARARELETVVRDILEFTRKALDRQTAFAPGTASGVVRIAMPDLHCALMTPPVLDLFRHEAPGLQLSVRPLIRQQALDALAANETDLAIGHFMIGQEGFLSKILFEDHHVVIARGTIRRSSAGSISRRSCVSITSWSRWAAILKGSWTARSRALASCAALLPGCRISCQRWRSCRAPTSSPPFRGPPPRPLGAISACAHSSRRSHCRPMRSVWPGMRAMPAADFIQWVIEALAQSSAE